MRAFVWLNGTVTYGYVIAVAAPIVEESSEGLSRHEQDLMHQHGTVSSLLLDGIKPSRQLETVSETTARPPDGACCLVWCWPKCQK
jgi:hypothetical protein